MPKFNEVLAKKQLKKQIEDAKKFNSACVQYLEEFELKFSEGFSDLDKENFDKLKFYLSKSLVEMYNRFTPK